MTVNIRTPLVVAAGQIEQLQSGDVLQSLISVTSAAFSSTMAPPDGSACFNICNMGQITANVTVGAPGGTPVDGNHLHLRMSIDGTGGYTISWNSIFAWGTDITASLVPTSASANFELMAVYHAATSKWRMLSIARGF
jgi:hypothetical protein